VDDRAQQRGRQRTLPFRRKGGERRTRAFHGQARFGKGSETPRVNATA
jgi:hypothetical protein